MDHITNKLKSLQTKNNCIECDIKIYKDNKVCCGRWCLRCLDLMSDTRLCILCNFKECYICEDNFVKICDGCGFCFCKNCCNLFSGHTGNSYYNLCLECYNYEFIPQSK
jgi:hypothetical protein